MTTITMRESAELATQCAMCGTRYTAQPDKPRRADKLAAGGKAKPAADADDDWTGFVERRAAEQFADELDRAAPAKDGDVSGETVSTETPEDHDPSVWLGDDEGPDDELPADTGQIVFIGCDLLHPHPANRAVSTPSCEALAQSIRAEGQLQPITVRVPPPHWKLPADHYQIVFGERRWRAAMIAGVEGVKAVIRTDLDDAATLRLIAIENGQREDLNPIDKARLIERLCLPVEQGGAGLTREAAARDVGLESGSAASNLVRLLALPDVWQQRVASGELPASMARTMLPYLPLEPVMKELEKAWRQREKQSGDPWSSNTFESRARLESDLDDFVYQTCRSLDDTRYCSELGNSVGPLFDVADEANRKKCGIVAVDLPDGEKGKTKRVEIATNIKAYDALQLAAIKQRSKKKAEKAGRDTPAKADLSPAERRARAQQAAKLLAERIAAWRHKLIRWAIAERVQEGDDPLRLLLGYLAEANYRGPSLRELLHVATEGPKLQAAWPLVAAYDDGPAWRRAVSQMAMFLLKHESRDWRQPTLSHGLVEGLAQAWEISLSAAWAMLQETVGGKLRGGDLLEEFFLLHQTEPLLGVCRELGVHCMPTATRGQMVKLLLAKPLNSHQRLKMPNAIKPLAAPKEKPAKAKKAK